MNSTGMNKLEPSQQKILTSDYYTKVLLKVCKALKSSEIVLYPDKILGSNDECSVVNVAEGVYTGVEISCHITLDNLVLIGQHQDKLPDAIYGFAKEYPSREIEMTYNRMLYYTSYTPVSTYIPDVRGYSNFDDIMDHKVADGAFPLKLTHDDIIYVYPQMIGLNKPDKISLFFYKLNNFNIAHFKIDKKFCIIDRYIAYIDISV